MDGIIGFIFGLMVGGIFGFIVSILAIAAGNEDHKDE